MSKLSKAKRKELRYLRESSSASAGKAIAPILSSVKYLTEWAWSVFSLFIRRESIKSKWFRAAKCGVQNFTICGRDRERRLGLFRQTTRADKTSLGVAGYFSFAIESRTRMNFQLCSFSVTFEISSRHYFKATDYLNAADQLALQLEMTRG